MDIKSLLSQDSPSKNRNTPPPPPQPTVSPRKHAQRPRSNSAGRSSRLARHVLTPSQPREPSPQMNSPTIGPVMGSGTGTPPSGELQPTRQPSTPGMDTLADLASMQHHQPPRTAAQSVLRTESYESQLSPSTMYPTVQSVSRNTPTSRASFDVPLTDSSKDFSTRDYSDSSLTLESQQAATELALQIQQHPHVYELRVKLIRLLHQGFVDHVYPPLSPGSRGDPYRYDLLKDLRAAREEMDNLFALGEDLWAEWIRDETLLARTVDERIAVMELCQRSVEEEFGSTKLWIIYGEWVLYLYDSALSQAGETSTGRGTPWSEEDKIVGREVFSWQSVLDVWKKGAEATKWRMHDSQLVWDRYLDLALQDLNRYPSHEKVTYTRALFESRLQTPHMSWDDTFKAFSPFVSKYYNANYEEIMVDTNSKAADIKALCSARETREAALKLAADSGDDIAKWAAFTEYIEWETSPTRKKRMLGFYLACSLYQRAVLRFPTESDLWEEYIMYLVDESIHGHKNAAAIPVLERATRHCPWSGSLWSQFLLSAEREGFSFTQIADIKHKATRTGLLDAGGIDQVLKVHTTWCSYLRRKAFQLDSTDEELDVAEVGIRSAIESVQELGDKEKKTVPNDPLFRLERIYIRLLSESGSWDTARETFKGLISRHGHSYEFWLMYYTWELLCWSKFTQSDVSASASRRTPNPSYATAVLKQALRRTDLDWPEKIMDTYIAHCEHYEDAEELQLAVVEIRKAMKVVAKRRLKEADTSVAAAATQQIEHRVTQAATTVYHSVTEPVADQELVPMETDTPSGKRKRSADRDANGVASKRPRSDGPEAFSAEKTTLPAEQKRDRENATVIVKSLPSNVTALKIRQFFRDCGSINSLKIVPSGGTTVSAIIEFESKEDAVSAQTRDGKYFDGNTIEVAIESQSTLFVTNFPPNADENYIRNLFSSYGEVVDVRFPSLKYNTHRRFCYVQFRSSASAHDAAELDKHPVGDKLQLVVKISDPSRRQARTGPVEEGREIHVSNLPWDTTEDNLRDFFSVYGAVETSRIPTKVDGRGKGFGFVVFSSKDEAHAAVEADGKDFRSRAIHVHLSTHTGSKRISTTIISRVGKQSSPPVEVNGHATPPAAASDSTNRPVGDRNLRTISLMNIPDTFNTARIQALVSPYGPIVKIILRPDHQGAIVEFVDVNDAGKASLGLDRQEIIPGRAIRIGLVGEMLKQPAEKKIDRIQVGKKQQQKGSSTTSTTMLQPTAPIRRPGQPRTLGGGRRGGLGLKTGVIRPSAAGSEKAALGHTDGTVDAAGSEPEIPASTIHAKKTNDDFRAMLQQSKQSS